MYVRTYASTRLRVSDSAIVRGYMVAVALSSATGNVSVSHSAHEG